MALNNNLLVSWNFETVSGSNSSGEFEVADVSTTYSGKGRGFTSNSQEFLLKEDILTGKKQHFETLEGIDTIQLVDGDDERISALKKPSSIRLAIENSMYQVVSDEMLNLFTTVNAYAFKFTVPDNKYRAEYDELKALRKGFFENIDGKPDLERYIEFYKWIDSSLGALIDQLKPENSSDISGLKTTVESHILERNKFQHKLPVTIQPNKVFTNTYKPITVIKSTPANVVIDGQSSAPHKQPFLTDTIEDIVSAENIQDKNYSKNIEFIQTAGKIHNNRDPKTNKSVIQTRFSAGDGLSERNRDASGEFSVYNETNQRAITQRTAYNISQSADRRIDQGTNNPLTGSDFEDNAFIQRNVPYTASNYHETGVVGYQQFAEGEVATRRLNNILLKNLDTGLEVIEPPIQYAVSAKHKLRMDGAFEDMDIESPYYSAIDTFTPRTLNVTGTSVYFDRPDFGRLDNGDTFYKKIDELSGGLTVKRVEILDNIYPRKDMMGRAVVRTKPDYEEVSGTFSVTDLTWSQNSYNNNSADIRSFWRDDINNRRRTRGLDNPPSYSGSINCIGSYNVSSSDDLYNYVLANNSSNTASMAFVLYNGVPLVPTPIVKTNLNVFASSSFYDSINQIDSDNEFSFYSGSYGPKIDFNNVLLGDLSPLPHNLAANVLLGKKIKAKPQFIFNNFIGYSLALTSGSPLFNGTHNFRLLINKSYQTPPDSELIPFYDSYNEYYKNIKHLTQEYSIIPEFIVGNFSNILSSQESRITNYLQIKGNNNFSNEYYNQNFTIDFPSIVDSDSNKIKFSISAIKKLLPYNGFYPSQRSTQVVKDFSDTYIDPQNTEQEKQIILQPLFAPGILFNTVKAGLAVDFPAYINDDSKTFADILIQSNEWDETSNVYTGENFGVYGVKEFTTRLPFETILSPKNYLYNKKNENKYYYYLDPSHYSWLFTSGSSYQTNPIVPKLNLTDVADYSSTATDLYELAINNYLSEIPNFFLKNSQLTNFLTAPETQFNNVVSGSVYEMRISIEKNSNYSSFKKITNSSSSINYFNRTEQFLYGPSVRNNDNSCEPFKFETYAPYSPPYYMSGVISTELETKFNFSTNINFYNPSNALTITNESSSLGFNEIKIQYIPENTGKPTVSDIIKNLKVIIPSEHTSSTSYCLKWAMSLAQSLLLNQKVSNPSITRDPTTGKVLQSFDDASNNRWAIQTKFEVPLIDYTDVALTGSTLAGSSSIYIDNTSTKVQRAINLYFDVTNYQGIWNTYGSIPKDGQSIQIKILDEGASNSLLKIVNLEPQTKSIGQFANYKIISEAIVMLPFSDKQQSDVLFFQDTERKYLFKIEEQKINNLLKVPDYKKLSIKDIKLILDTDSTIDKNNSIVNLMNKMVNYNLPLHLNWLYEADKKTPFVMYIAEVTHSLDKQDLADIWQGTMPKICLTPEQQKVIIEHNREENELFGNLDLKKYNIKMNCFKIKKRANSDYKQITLDNQDYNEKIPWYTYNWPYDYFSLVELVNIQGGEVYESGSI